MAVIEHANTLRTLCKSSVFGEDIVAATACLLRCAAPKSTGMFMLCPIGLTTMLAA